MTNETVFQRLVGDEEQVEQMIDDLKSLDETGTEGWELALTFEPDDIPHIIEELEAIDHDGG